MSNRVQSQGNNGYGLEELLPLRPGGNPLWRRALHRLAILALACGLATVILATILVGEWLFP